MNPRPLTAAPIGSAKRKAGQAQSADNDCPPSVIDGRYRILGTLGQGGMGRVYRAGDERSNRCVAVKVPAPGAVTEDAERQRFLNQGLVLERIGHRSVVRPHGQGVTPAGMPYVVLEVVEGQDLAHRLAIQGRLPAHTVARIGLQLACALAAIDRASLVHCDVKPSNIMLLDASRSPHHPRIKLVDFGSARMHTRQGAIEQGCTASTLEYIAPEVLSGRGSFTHVSDIYAAGCVLYELLAGQPPFMARTLAETRLAILHDAPAELEHVPARLWQIVSACLSKDPERRPQTAVALAAQLQDQRWPGSWPR